MKAREHILGLVKKNKPRQAEQAVHGWDDYKQLPGDPRQFMTVAGKMGSHVMTRAEAGQWLLETAPVARIHSFTDEFVYTSSDKYPSIVVAKAAFGVAENACLWVSDRHAANMLLLFTCEHLVLVVAAADIVANMHGAYDRIKNEEAGYGVFIAGPSKTADIEQLLVTGAHGPKKCTIVVI